MEKITSEDLNSLVKIARLMQEQLNKHERLIENENFDVTQLFDMFIFDEVRQQNRVEDFLSSIETVCEWQETSDFCYEFLDKALKEIKTDQQKPKLTLVSST